MTILFWNSSDYIISNKKNDIALFSHNIAFLSYYKTY